MYQKPYTCIKINVLLHFSDLRALILRYNKVRGPTFREDRASATEAVDLGSIPGRVKPKTIKIGTHSFPAWRSAIKGTV